MGVSPSAGAPTTPSTWWKVQTSASASRGSAPGRTMCSTIFWAVAALSRCEPSLERMYCASDELRWMAMSECSSLYAPTLSSASTVLVSRCDCCSAPGVFAAMRLSRASRRRAYP